MVLKHYPLSSVREEGSSPERPATPTRSSPPSASRSSLRRSQSSCQLDARQPSLLSRGSSPNLAGMHAQPDPAAPSGREDVKRKSPAGPWQVLPLLCLQYIWTFQIVLIYPKESQNGCAWVLVYPVFDQHQLPVMMCVASQINRRTIRVFAQHFQAVEQTWVTSWLAGSD
jgi:hypothetical protein